MLETLTIITLCTLYLVFFRPGKTPPLESPLVIERAGQYHITFAPQLNLAQPFIEEVARQAGSGAAASSSETHYFAVRDAQVMAHGFNFYLLAVTRRDGVLYFQAAKPDSQAPEARLPTIRAFAAAALARVQADEVQVDADAAVLSAVAAAARLRGVTVESLSN